MKTLQEIKKEIAANTERTGGEECYVDDEIAEAVYRFRD